MKQMKITTSSGKMYSAEEVQVLLGEKLDELLFDLHIRGCKLADHDSNNACNEFKARAVSAAMLDTVKPDEILKGV
jgi:hypothetical protein